MLDELWVVGKVSNHFQGKHRFASPGSWATSRILNRFSVTSELVSFSSGFKLKTLDYIFNRLPIAAIRDGIAGLPLTPGLDCLCFDSMRELAQGVIGVIDDVARLNALQRAAYEKCESGFDWGDRGRTLCDAIHDSVERRRAVHASESA